MIVSNLAVNSIQARRIGQKDRVFNKAQEKTQ